MCYALRLNQQSMSNVLRSNASLLNAAVRSCQELSILLAVQLGRGCAMLGHRQWTDL